MIEKRSVWGNHCLGEYDIIKLIADKYEIDTSEISVDISAPDYQYGDQSVSFEFYAKDELLYFICDKCGYEIELAENMNYCPKCGTKIDLTEETNND